LWIILRNMVIWSLHYVAWRSSIPSRRQRKWSYFICKLTACLPCFCITKGTDSIDSCGDHLSQILGILRNHKSCPFGTKIAVYTTLSCRSQSIRAHPDPRAASRGASWIILRIYLIFRSNSSQKSLTNPSLIHWRELWNVKSWKWLPIGRYHSLFILGMFRKYLYKLWWDQIVSVRL
jgi:hypothetical protein